ncbi:MAG: hypothetical protein WCR30_01975 [Clostridia bacterium]
MNKKGNGSPLELLITIVERHRGHEVCEILNTNQDVTHINCIGYGTADSEIADLFGFGISERDVVLSLVQSENSVEILKKLNEKFDFNKKNNGISFTIPVNSIEKKLYNLLKMRG